MGNFSTTFAPIEDLSAGLKLALDLIGLGFALAFSPVWNSGRPHSYYFARFLSLITNVVELLA